MTSEKSYSIEQRFSALIATLGPLATFIPDSGWTDSGSLSNGWGKGSGYFRWKKILPSTVAVAVKDLNTGTTTVDGTEILSAANGLSASGYHGSTNKRIACFADQERIAVGSNVESAALLFVTDGSVQCLGVGGSATTVSCYGLLFTDI